jgi:hypothetical protein
MALKTHKLGKHQAVAGSRRLEQLEGRLVMSGSEFSTVVANDVVTMRLAPDDSVVTTRSTSGLNARLSSDFHWGTHYDLPGTVDDGLTRFDVVSNIWFPVVNGVRDESRADEATARRIARESQAAGRMLVVNIEAWPADTRVYGEALVSQAIERYSEVLDWIRDETPDLKIGLYGIFPLRDYVGASFSAVYDSQWGSPAGTSQFSAVSNRLAQWHNANDRLGELASKVDVIYPSLYAFYNNPSEWVGFATNMIAEARRYGKPVVPFLMGYYHEAAQPSSLRGQDIDPVFWQSQLDTVRRLADGVILFVPNWQMPTVLDRPSMQAFLNTAQADIAGRSVDHGSYNNVPEETPGSGGSGTNPDAPTPADPIDTDTDPIIDSLVTQATHTWFEMLLLASRQFRGSVASDAISEIQAMVARSGGGWNDLISAEAASSELYRELLLATEI